MNRQFALNDRCLPDDISPTANEYYTPFDISPDGRRFLMARRGPPPEVERSLELTENWFTELRQRLCR